WGHHCGDYQSDLCDSGLGDSGAGGRHCRAWRLPGRAWRDDRVGEHCRRARRRRPPPAGAGRGGAGQGEKWPGGGPCTGRPGGGIAMWLFILGLLLTAGPWTLVSQIRREECRGLECRPFAVREGPQERVVQTFGTAEECLRVREQLMAQKDEALEAV